jgi:L-ascorbate metabolism protein UlaG (beta-lactamase superfamily)
MKLIGELYKPDIAFLPIGDRFTMGPTRRRWRRSGWA